MIVDIRWSEEDGRVIKGDRGRQSDKEGWEWDNTEAEVFNSPYSGSDSAKIKPENLAQPKIPVILYIPELWLP